MLSAPQNPVIRPPDPRRAVRRVDKRQKKDEASSEHKHRQRPTTTPARLALEVRWRARLVELDGVDSMCVSMIAARTPATSVMTCGVCPVGRAELPRKQFDFEVFYSDLCVLLCSCCAVCWLAVEESYSLRSVSYEVYRSFPVV